MWGRSHGEKYGVVHRTMRRRLGSVVATGTVPCARCGDLIGAGERWELDHRDDGRGYGPSHFRCNRRAGWDTMMAATNGNGRYVSDPALRWSRRWCMSRVWARSCFLVRVGRGSCRSWCVAERGGVGPGLVSAPSAARAGRLAVRREDARPGEWPPGDDARARPIRQLTAAGS